MGENHNTVRKFIRRASTGMIQNLSSELQPIPESSLDSQDYGRSLRVASTTVTSFANDVWKVLGINQNNEKIEDEGKGFHDDIFHEIAEDKAKFQALKMTLRNKRVGTNAAVRQYLLDHDRFGHSSTKSSNESQTSDMVQKERNGFRWKVQSEPSIRRFKNIKFSNEC